MESAQPAPRALEANLAPIMTAKRQTTDPLVAFGPSLFLSILLHVPFDTLLTAEAVSSTWRTCIRTHERTIWRAACYRTGVEAAYMRTMRAMERGLAATSMMSWQGEEGEEEEHHPGETMGSVDWRAMCQAYVGMDRNWRFGRCRERWVTSPGNHVWKFKVDPEQNTMLYTGRHGGLGVVDYQTSLPLFKIAGLRSYAHLEFTRGFAIFNTDSGLEIYRSEPCIKRSTHPTPRPSDRSSLSKTAISHTNPAFEAATNTAPLPRGHLSYYRTITPFTPCLAFRARVDHSDEVEGERAMLATGGEEALYIWDLEEGTLVERYDIKAEDQERILYIEFDDQYVFTCNPSHAHVYSRRTRERVITLPPRPPLDPEAVPAFAFALSVDSIPPRVPPSREDAPGYPGLRNVQTGRMTLHVIVKDVPGWDWMVPTECYKDETARPPRGQTVWNFCGCHYTPDDLIYTSTAGVIFIIRDYQAVFLEPDLQIRQSRMVANTICLTMQDPVLNLATCGTHVVVTTLSHVYFIDTRSLPIMPLPADSPVPPSPLDIYVMRSTMEEGINGTSCLQVDSKRIYMNYSTWEDEGAPEAAMMDDFDMDDFTSVRVWDFGMI